MNSPWWRHTVQHPSARWLPPNLKHWWCCPDAPAGTAMQNCRESETSDDFKDPTHCLYTSLWKMRKVTSRIFCRLPPLNLRLLKHHILQSFSWLKLKISIKSPGWRDQELLIKCKTLYHISVTAFLTVLPKYIINSSSNTWCGPEETLKDHFSQLLFSICYATLHVNNWKKLCERLSGETVWSWAPLFVYFIILHMTTFLVKLTFRPLWCQPGAANVSCCPCVKVNHSENNDNNNEWFLLGIRFQNQVFSCLLKWSPLQPSSAYTGNQCSIICIVNKIPKFTQEQENITLDAKK